MKKSLKEKVDKTFEIGVITLFFKFSFLDFEKPLVKPLLF